MVNRINGDSRHSTSLRCGAVRDTHNIRNDDRRAVDTYSRHKEEDIRQPCGLCHDNRL